MNIQTKFDLVNQ